MVDQPEKKKLVGVIDLITPRPTTRGTAYDIIIDGVGYSTFRPGGAKAGDTVEIEYVVNGSFNNIWQLTVVPATGQTKMSAFTGETPKTISTAKRIAMQSLYHVAAVALQGTPEAKDPKKVYQYAEALYKLHQEDTG